MKEMLELLSNLNREENKIGDRFIKYPEWIICDRYIIKKYVKDYIYLYCENGEYDCKHSQVINKNDINNFMIDLFPNEYQVYLITIRDQKIDELLRD